MASNNTFIYLNEPDKMKSSELIQLILQDHHAYVRAETPVLLRMAAEAEHDFGNLYPELARIAEIVNDIMRDMDMHQMKEERILFPFIQAMEYSASSGEPIPQSCFGDVRNPIRAMENDHENVHSLLEELKSLTNDFTSPQADNEMLNNYYERMKRFRDNTFRHVYLENEVLFKKAAEMQSRLS